MNQESKDKIHAMCESAVALVEELHIEKLEHADYMLLANTLDYVDDLLEEVAKLERVNKQLSDGTREQAKNCYSTSINKGMDETGEYDIESDWHCPVCKTVVGNAETNELYCEYCPECGQKLKLPEGEE